MNIQKGCFHYISFLFPGNPVVQFNYLYGFIVGMKCSVDPDQLASSEASFISSQLI